MEPVLSDAILFPHPCAIMTITHLVSRADEPFLHHSSHAGLDATSHEPFGLSDWLCCGPAFTEAALVSSPSDAFTKSLTRLYDGEMGLDPGLDLKRSTSPASQLSGRSVRSRSRTRRSRPRKHASYASSRTSSTAPSDKSLTSFPSLSPEFPSSERSFTDFAVNGGAETSRKSSGRVPSIVDSLTTSSPQDSRDALFDDAPIATSHVPGSIHLASDEHVGRLIARHGAVTLVKQIAEDLAQRDAQITALRRKTEERERALRKIILECGLSNLDLETRLRAIEEKAKAADETAGPGKDVSGGLEDMINDAMSNSFTSTNIAGDVTIRASEQSNPTDVDQNGTARGWKDLLWGIGTTKKLNGPATIKGANTDKVTATRRGGGRRTVLEDDLFAPPNAGSVRSSSRASSMQSSARRQDRKPSTSLATLALKLVAGNANVTREDGGVDGRGRATSNIEQHVAGRSPSAASARTSVSAISVHTKLTPTSTPKMIAGYRRRTGTPATVAGNSSNISGERWDTMGASPQNLTTHRPENYGPVEMDSILPPDAQPPTMTSAYINRYNPEFLTDRFGFIYDQRRKKRQKDAAESMQKTKRSSRMEMLSSARSGLSPPSIDDDIKKGIESTKTRPDSPISVDDRVDDGKPAKRWQDYLKIATFPTELLSHTPSGSAPSIEIMEATSGASSPGISTEERGFMPSVSTAEATTTIGEPARRATISKPAETSATAALGKEDGEPVKLLLEQLSDVHDSLQRDKTVRWNDFLRKVRAERKREGEAAAAALASATETRSQRAMTVMPEVSLADGEVIGISGLGVKGKVGRAKWNEFKSLVLAGIPVAYRAKIWAECSGATALRVPGYYDELVARDGSKDDPAIVSQIQMDINRTLTDNIFFRRGPGVAKLNEVLLAYSRRNPEVGYCQGMNLITACLLLIMPTAEDAFWILTSIVEKILPQGYYDHSLLASRADQQVLRQYVAEILPKLSAHLDILGVELEALTFQWFLSVFTDCLSAEALFRVWDVVLCINDGSTFLFQVALALLKLNEAQLLQCATPAGIYTYINHQMTNHAISIDGLIHASEGLRRTVRREDVEARRARAIESEKLLMRQREERNSLRRAERLAALNTTTHTPPSHVEQPIPGARIEGMNPSNDVDPDADSDAGAMGELTVRSPMPVEDERDLNLE